MLANPMNRFWIPAVAVALALAQQPKRAPVAADVRLVRVVDAATNAPVAGAEVIALGHEAALEFQKANDCAFDWAFWEQAREQVGKRTHTDAAGLARLPRVAGKLLLFARTPGRWASAESDGTTQQTLELRLEPDSTLAVEVVDEAGRPAGDVGVSLAIAVPDESEHGADPPDRIGPFQATCATDPRDGIARFFHAQTLLQSQRNVENVAMLAIPLAHPVETKIDVAQIGRARPRLVLPPTGSVLVTCPDAPKGCVRIRRARRDLAAGTIWFSTSPLWTTLVDGKALFPHVGLGLEIEYEVRGPGLEQRLRGTFAGPTRAGEQVHFACPGKESVPMIVGRIIDEDRKPVADRGLSVLTIVRQGNASSSRGTTARTDDAGRFRIPLSEPITSGLLSVELSVDGSFGREIALPSQLPPGPYDCGDVLLAPGDSTRELHRLTEAELEIEYREASARTEAGRKVPEMLLTEMTRRGGAHWEEFFERELASTTSGYGPKEAPYRLELLTSLRRAQGKPDPLTLGIEGAPVVECTFPDWPVLTVQMTNVDVEGASFEATDGGDYRSGRFARCHVEASDAQGRSLDLLKMSNGIGGGVSSNRLLKSGESLEFSLPLQSFVEITEPGDYLVVVRYHDQDSIDSDAALAGRIVSSSRPFTVRVHRRRIELTRNELEASKRAIQEIDCAVPVLLVSGHWTETLVFDGPPKSPEDRLFRAGWKSVPALLDALEDGTLDRERRAWVFGMLWNITGQLLPASSCRPGATGRTHLTKTWPGASEQEGWSLAVAGWVDGVGTPSLDAQMQLTEEWRALRGLIELKLVE